MPKKEINNNTSRFSNSPGINQEENNKQHDAHCDTAGDDIIITRDYIQPENNWQVSCSLNKMSES